MILLQKSNSNMLVRQKGRPTDWLSCNCVISVKTKQTAASNMLVLKHMLINLIKKVTINTLGSCGLL